MREWRMNMRITRCEARDQGLLELEERRRTAVGIQNAGSVGMVITKREKVLERDPGDSSTGADNMLK